MATENRAFRKLQDDPSSRRRLEELARRGQEGTKAGVEELQRTQKQSQVGASTAANMRAAAAAGATSGVKGATQASKLAGIAAGGMSQMAGLESDLAARDYEAKQAAKTRLSEMQADLSQQAIGQDKAALEFKTAKSDTASNLKANLITALIAQGIDVGSPEGKQKLLAMQATLNA